MSNPGSTESSVLFADGTESQASQTADGTITTTLANGTVPTIEQVADSVLGMHAPTQSSSTRLPSGLTRTTSVTESATQTDPHNPLSVSQRVTSTAINGR